MKNKILTTAYILAALFVANQASAYYSPSTGRWLSRDPMGEPGFEALRSASAVPRVGQVASTASLPPSRLFVRDTVAAKIEPNRYEFVANNPITRIDPDGRFVWPGPTWPPEPPDTSWINNLFCSCKCRSVKVTGKPSDPPSLGIYTENGNSKFGNEMTITWTVSGNPKKCHYGQNETGSAMAYALTGNGDTHLSNYNFNYSIVTAKYDSGSATYPDYIGFSLTSPHDDGKWNYSWDLNIELTCTSSDGSKMTGQTIKFKSDGSFDYPK
jgi:hypothetical protein